VLLDLGSAELEQVGTWDPLGMRGTCSPGFVLRARFGPERVVPAPFAEVASRSMVPLSHILWSHVWLGTAGEAFERASAFVRADARRRPGTVPPTAGRLAELAVVMGRMRAEIADATGSYVTACESPAGEAELDTIGHALRINAFKVSVSETAAQICLGALAICGMAGYKNDSSISIGRLLRDALSAALMIGNDRILATDASLLLVHKG
jgi:acyl-CoA dehydrogenase